MNGVCNSKDIYYSLSFYLSGPEQLNKQTEFFSFIENSLHLQQHLKQALGTVLSPQRGQERCAEKEEEMGGEDQPCVLGKDGETLPQPPRFQKKWEKKKKTESVLH